MNNRLIAFIVILIIAILSTYAQEAAAPSAHVTTSTLAPRETDLLIPAPPAPPILEEPKITTPAIFEPQQSAATVTDTVNIGLSAEVRQKEAALLNSLLADEYVLYTETLKCHWNVQGIVFHDFHALFKEQYEKLFDIVDLVAERARALGAPTLGSLKEFSTYTRLKEMDATTLTPIQMVQRLLAGHEAIIRTIRADIDATAQLGDQGTSNFLQDLIIKHEKIAWMLRATAQ